MDIDFIVEKYAAKAERIYNEETAVEHTWTGLLASFLMEVKNSGETL